MLHGPIAGRHILGVVRLSPTPRVLRDRKHHVERDGGSFADYRRGFRRARCQVFFVPVGPEPVGSVLAAGLSICWVTSHLVRRR